MSLLMDAHDKDFEWYSKDRVSYLKEETRREEEYQRQLCEHMGPQFSNEPKQYKKELENEIWQKNKYINDLKKLNVPKDIIKYQRTLYRLLNEDYKSKKYITTIEELNYRRSYDKKVASFKFKFIVKPPAWLNYTPDKNLPLADRAYGNAIGYSYDTD